MPFPLLKLLFLLVSLAVLLLILLYVSLSVNFPLSASPSFFPTSAIISLAEDNSTFFLSKPAAFGPLLPKKGLTGELLVLPESELACDDASRDGFTWRDEKDILVGKEIDAKTDDHIGVKRVKMHADLETLQESAEISGKIVLVVRGGCGFYDKVLWSQRRGAIAVIVGDNEAHRPLLTMYAKGDTSNISIPAIFTSYTTAHLLTSLLPKQPPKSSSSSSYRQRPAYSPVSTPRPERGGISSYFSRYKSEDRSSREYDPYTAKPVESSVKTPELDDIEIYEDITPPQKSRYDENSPLGPHDEQGNSVTDGSVALEGFGWLGENDGEPSGQPDKPDMSHGLWITLTPTRLSSSPFVDTLLVLVVSPVITLTVVYTMLLLRSRYRRRRWRAPKSIVDQLPVHTYQPPSDPPSPSAPQNIPSSSETNNPQHSEKSKPGSLVVSSFPDTNQASTSSSSHFPPLSRVSSAPPPTTAALSAKQKSKSPYSRRNMKILPGFKYFPPSPECVVCLEEYVEGVSQVMRLPCGHEFHVNCITPWLTTRRRTCPVCKCDVVKALGGGNGYSATNGGDEENQAEASDRPIGAVEGRGTRGADVWWRTLLRAFGVDVSRRDGDVGETTPLIHDEDDRRRD